jgi:hypothetical protein
MIGDDFFLKGFDFDFFMCDFRNKLIDDKKG